SAETPFPTPRPASSAPGSCATSSPTWRSEDAPETGGGGSSSANTSRRSLVGSRSGSPDFSLPIASDPLDRSGPLATLGTVRKAMKSFWVDLLVKASLPLGVRWIRRQEAAILREGRPLQ